MLTASATPIPHNVKQCAYNMRKMLVKPDNNASTLIANRPEPSRKQKTYAPCTKMYGKIVTMFRPR